MWQKDKLAKASAKSDKDLESWQREGNVPWSPRKDGEAEGKTTDL